MEGGPAADDWRRQGQETYLKGVPLVRSAYRRYSESWDHDHCSFCSAKFMLAEGELQEGYCTVGEYHWICIPCFEDFVVEFGWEVVEPPGQ